MKTKYVLVKKNIIKKCLDINLSDPFTVYGNIYNLFQSENKCEMYVVSQHKRKEGTCKFYGQKIILSDSNTQIYHKIQFKSQVNLC